MARERFQNRVDDTTEELLKSLIGAEVYVTIGDVTLKGTLKTMVKTFSVYDEERGIGVFFPVSSVLMFTFANTSDCPPNINIIIWNESCEDY